MNCHLETKVDLTEEKVYHNFFKESFREKVWIRQVIVEDKESFKYEFERIETK